MLFSNFLCLFYLMVLTRCHTVSKSIASYDQLDDVIDSVNDYPLASVFNVRHERIHPKYRRDKFGATTELVAKAPEITTKSKEKTTTSLMTKGTTRKPTKAHKTNPETTKSVTAVQNDKFKVNDNTEKSTINLFRRLQHKFSWKNKICPKNAKKKRKTPKKHKKMSTKDKVDRDKRVAMYTTPFNEFDQVTDIFTTFKTPPKTIPDENIISNIKIENIIQGTDSERYQITSPADSKESTLPIPSSTESFPIEMQDDVDIYRGTAGIEALLNKIKMHAINIISEQSPSVGEIISNSVTETTFDADPVILRTMTMRKYTVQPNYFNFNDIIGLAEFGEENRKVCVAPKTIDNVQPNEAVGYDLKNKLQQKMKFALRKAKDTLTGGLNKARNQVKSVTCSVMHDAANGLNNIANKIEHLENVKDMPEQEVKINSTQTRVLKPTQVSTPSLTKPSKLKNYKLNLKSTTSTTRTKKSALHLTTTKSRGRSTTIMSSKNEKYAEEESQDDYSMLKIYEKVLSNNDSPIKMLTTIAVPGTIVKGFKDKVSKRDTDTLEHLNLKETIRKINDEEGMPDADYNNDFRKPSMEQTHSPSVELYNDGNTLKLTETTLRELTNPDYSYLGLTNKIHYNEFINGYKHYLNFERDLLKSDHNYSNLVRYQAHKHHNVDDIGKFILTRLPPIPNWKPTPEFDNNNHKAKRAPLFEELDEANRKISAKKDGSWFKRHFNLFCDSEPKKKFHTKETVTLRSEIPKDNTEENAQAWKVDSTDNRQLAEREGLKFHWKTHNKQEKVPTEGAKIKPEPSLPPYRPWEPEGEAVNSNIENTNPDVVNKHLETDFKEIMKRIGNISDAVIKPYSGVAKSQPDLDLNELIKKISKSSAKMAITQIFQENAMPSSAEQTTYFDLQRLLALMSTTPSEYFHLNELVTALVLQNSTPKNSKITNIKGARHAISINIHKRPAVDKNVDATEDDRLQEHRAKKDKKNSFLQKEEFEHIIKSIPLNLYQDAALYPQQDMKFDKFGYVNLDLVAKPVTIVQQKKKSKFTKLFNKWKCKKKKNKKLEGKSRKTRHSPFKMLKNLFKSVQNDSDDSIYGTTEPFSYERSIKKFMQQVPNISTDEVTYKPYLSSLSFQTPPTHAPIKPVLAVTTSSRHGTYTAAAATDVQQQIKKIPYKPVYYENDSSMPLSFRVNPNLKNKLSPTLHVTLMPVTLDELMKELSVNTNNNKFKNFAKDGRNTLKPIVSKLKFKPYFDNMPFRDLNRFFKSKNNTTRNVMLYKDFKRYSVPSHGLTNFKQTQNYSKVENLLYEDDSNRNENQVKDIKKIRFDKDQNFNKFNALKNTEYYDNNGKRKGILFNRNHNGEPKVTSNLKFGKKRISNTKCNRIKNSRCNTNENINKNQYKYAISQYKVLSNNISSNNQSTEQNRLSYVENDEDTGKHGKQFAISKKYRYDKTKDTKSELKTYNSEHNNYDLLKTTSSKYVKRNGHQFSGTKTIHHNNNIYSSTDSSEMHGFNYTEYDSKQYQNTNGAKIQHPAFVLPKSKTKVNIYENEMPAKSYKNTKPYKSYTDYFNDFINWNQDILSLDCVTDVSVDNIISSLMNVTTADIHKLRDEILHMQNFIKSTNSKKASIATTTIPKMKTPSTKMLKKVTMTKKEAKVVKRRGNNNEKTKLQSLERLNQMVDDINKMYRQSFNKYGIPEENSKGSVLTTFSLNDATESPIMDTTILAYDDTLNILSDEFNKDAYHSTPKTIRSKINSKGILSSKTKISPSPKQFFRKPVPMQSSEFDQFLKDHGLDIPNITSTNSEISQFEENWEKGQHIQSKLMDTKGNHKKTLDVPKMLKNLKMVDLTPDSVTMKPSNSDKKISSNKVNSIKYKVPKIENNAVSDNRGNLVYSDDAEYTAFIDNNVETRSKIENTYYNNIGDSIKVKRKMKPSVKTSSVTPFQVTNTPNSLNFDITIIDIDDMMSISKPKIVHSSPATETVNQVPETQIPVRNTTKYSSLDIDPEPQSIPGYNNMMPQKISDHYPVHNSDEPEEDNVLNNEQIEDSYRHRDHSFSLQKNVRVPLHENEKYKTSITKKNPSKYKPIVTSDSAESEIYLNSLGTKVNRKQKMLKGKNQHDKYSEKLPNLHNDLLYQNFNVDQFVGTTPEHTLFSTKGLSTFFHHNHKNKPIKHPSTTIAMADDDDSEKIEHMLNSRRELNLHTDTQKMQSLKVNLKPKVTRAYTTQKTTEIYNGADLFTVKPSKGQTSVHPFTPASKINLFQKFRKQPKRIMFSSNTLKYDVVYDDNVKKLKSFHQGYTRSRHHTLAPNHAEMTKVSRSNHWIDGVGGDGEINADANEILREVVERSKGDRKRRKAMWRKWKTTSDSTNPTIATNTTKQPRANLTPTRKWFEFLPMMQKSNQKARTSPPATSTSSILILPSNSTTSSAILLSSSGFSQLVDDNRRKSSSDIVYIVDVLNGKHHVQMSAVSVATEERFPKPGNITLIYPARVVNDGGKPKLNPKEETFVEPDWATILKPHIPQFRPYHKQAEKCTKNFTCLRKPDNQHKQGIRVNDNSHKQTLFEAENTKETSPYTTETQESNWTFQDFNVEEKRETQPDRADYGSTLSSSAAIFTGPNLYDTSDKTHYFETVISQDLIEYVEKTTTDKSLDVSNTGIFTSHFTELADSYFALHASNKHNYKEFVNNASTPTQMKPSTQTSIDLNELKQEIEKIEKMELEYRILLNQEHSTLSKSLTDKEAVLDEIERSISNSYPKTNTKYTSTTTEKITTTKESIRKIAEEKQDANAENTVSEVKSINDSPHVVDKNILADIEKAVKTKSGAKSKEAKQNAKVKQIAGNQQIIAEQKAAKNEEAFEKAAKNADLRKGPKKTTTKSSETTTHNGTNNTLTSTTTKTLRKPSVLTKSKITKTTCSTSITGAKQITKISTTTEPTTTALPKTTTKNLTTTQGTRKAKNIKSRLNKRETPEADNKIYTAKDVAALEVIVDLMKDTTENARSKPAKYNDNYYHHNPSTNAIQVHIALPYQTGDKKRAAEPTKLRKVFSAKMSVPVDIEYQVRSLDVSSSIRTLCPKKSENGISPGMYLLVEDNKNNKGFALKPVVRQVSQDFTSSTMKTTSPKNFGRVTLSKDYIQSINNQLKQLYENLSTLDQSTKHTVKKRHAQSDHLRNRRIINWDKVRKLFMPNKRVCDCKCVANKTMCKACAASDAVMTELLFEFDNLAQYMNDHCTEIQTYFWMNPSGGRKLRDMVHKIDKNINDYYKRMNGKCQGTPCNALDKREITMPYIIYESDHVTYIEKPLFNDIENLAKSLQEAQKMNLVCSKELKTKVDHLVKLTNECTGNYRHKKSVTKQKKVYTLDNINVNIICNQDSVLQTETSSLPSSLYDLLTTEFPVFDYTDDEVKKTPRKSLKSIFVKKKNTRSHKKSLKRDTIVQIKSPLHVTDTQGLWREYLKYANETTTDHIKPGITLDVLEKIDEHTVTFNPRLKATLVKIVPGSSNNSKSKNEVLLQMFNLDPSRDNTKSHSNNEITELLKVLEPKTQENNIKSGYIMGRYAKATQTHSSTNKTCLPKDKVKIVSSVKTVTATNATLPSEIKPYANNTPVATTPIISMNTEAWYDGIITFKDENIVQDNQTSLLTSQAVTSNKTKESLFHRFKNIITPGFSHTQKPNEYDKHSQQELSNDMIVAMDANIDVISDITTTSFPTLFIIEDLANDTKNTDYENLLIKIMEYERDKLDSELTKHKVRQKNSSNVNKAINDVLVTKRNKYLRVVAPMTSLKPNKINTVAVAESDCRIHNLGNKHKTARSQQYEDVSTEKITTKQKETKTLIQMLLETMKRNTQKAGKQTINYLPQRSSTQTKKKKQKDLQSWLTPTEGNDEPAITQQEVSEPELTSQKLASFLLKPTDVPEIPQRAQIPKERTHINTNQQVHLDKKNMNWFLAQFASSIMFTNINDDISTYNDVLYSTSTSNSLYDYFPKTTSIKSTPSGNFGFVKSRVAVNSKVEVVPYSKKKTTTPFSLDVKYKKGEDITLSNTKREQNALTTESITTSILPSFPITTSLNESTEIDTTTEFSASMPFTTDKYNRNNTNDDEQEEYVEEVEANNAKSIESNNTKDNMAINSRKTTNKLSNKVEEKNKTYTLPKPKVTINIAPKPSKTQPIKSKLKEAKPKNAMNHNTHKENAADKHKKGKPTNEMNIGNITNEKFKEIKLKNELHNNNEEQSAESGFKKVLNKDLNKLKKSIREACDPKTEICLCDMGATTEHVIEVRKTSPRKHFEQYVKNVTCYAYKMPPAYFLLKPWKRKFQKRKHQKQRRFNKYLDSIPLKNSLKWDWIRKRRSLSSIEDDNVDDNDKFELDENNYYTTDVLMHQENNNWNGKPRITDKTKIGLIKNHYTLFDKDIDNGFESLYKGEDNVYRTIRKRFKRTAGDMKELAHGLRNLPPLQAKENELYVMLGDKISLDCSLGSRYRKPEHLVSWGAERSDMLASPNVLVNGPAVIMKKVEAGNAGNYTCSQNGKTRTVRLTVVTIPQFHVVFIPMYSSKQGCSYDDLRAMQHLGPLMSKESCTHSQNCNAIQIAEPICMEDKDDGSVHLRATGILTACPNPEVKCSAQCRRDLQCAFALICATNAPVLHGVKVVIARQAYNKTLEPSYGTNKRLIVTHTLRKKDLQKHTEYHQLAASMYPGNLDIVVSCPAGYYLIRDQKICAACPADTYAAAGENTCYSCAPGTSSEPGAARCKLSLRRMRRYDWWWYPPCGYAVAAVGVLCACVVCTSCALVAHVTSRSTRDRRPVSVARVESRWTWSRRTAMKKCSSTSAGEQTRGKPPSPSAVILARFFRPSASSSRATDSQETKFEQWKEKNIPPPLPPIDFDLS